MHLKLPEVPLHPLLLLRTLVIYCPYRLQEQLRSVRAVSVCVECRKPRVVYSSRKPSQRQKVLPATSLGETSYTCGPHLFSPAALQHVPVLRDMTVIVNLTCASPMQPVSTCNISSRLITIRLRAVPFNITIVQACTPTSDYDDNEIEEFYD